MAHHQGRPKHLSETYICLQDLNFGWRLADVGKFRRLWEAGKDIWEIARALGRDVDEVAILAMDQARQGKIGLRPGGVYGEGLR